MKPACTLAQLYVWESSFKSKLKGSTLHLTYITTQQILTKDEDETHLADMLASKFDGVREPERAFYYRDETEILGQFILA